MTPRALDDLVQIRDYLLARSPQGAENVRQAINAALELLQDFTFSGRERLDLGLRSVGVARYSYTIYCRVKDDLIEIIHVHDDRRQLPALPDF
jgi:plasmid stabilization system protein ParE